MLIQVAPQALFNFPALLGCVCVTAESVPEGVPRSSVREASKRYKVPPDAPT